MSVAARSETATILEKSSEELHVLICESEREIGTVASGFEQLAQQADAIVQLAGTVVCRVEDDTVLSVLPRVQRLGVEAKQFIRERLEATAGILEIVTQEARLLDRLSDLTRGQRSIARETRTLSVLTNIEVARLGHLGAGFQYLAHELDEFSELVTLSTKELAGHTDERRAAIKETSRKLAAALPRIQQEFTRIEGDLGSALAAIDSSLTQLTRAPAGFRASVEEIAGQIAAVVAAVQSHDITRQQLEHVEQALRSITARASGAERDEHADALEAPRISAGVAIQIYQLRSTRETVGQWISQMRSCLDRILSISSSEVVGIGPAVVGQERELSAHLAEIEQIEGECRAENKEMQTALMGLSSLMELVGEHLEKSRSVRDRMQVLTFNSIIEASRLGAKADAILEISHSIKRTSSSWSEMTDRSARAMEEILELVGKSKTELRAFSEDGNGELSKARLETATGLESLRAAAQFASDQAAAVDASTQVLQTSIARMSALADGMDGCFDHLGAVLEKVEDAGRRWEIDNPGAMARCDPEEMEAMFSASYTTEIERDVLRAALRGESLPVAGNNLAGNGVELF